MQAQIVLIADSRKEISQKYKRIIQQDCYVYPVVANSSQEAEHLIKELEPELIILSDNFDVNSQQFCSKIREISTSFRPVIVVVSKSDYLEDKLSSLRAGADDYLSEPIAQEEFSLRIFAHLRRHVEEASDPVTQLPSENMTYKVLQRTLDAQEKWGLLYVSIDNFKPYSEIYGHIAAEKMLKAFGAILKSAIGKGDFIGHLGDSNFIIITSPQKADKLATYLNFTFDSISDKFYTNKDAKRGYLILSSDQKADMRVSFVTTSVGIISNEYRSFNNFREALNSAININNMAKLRQQSSWIFDRPKISTTEDFTSVIEGKNKILILEPDAALAYLLKTTLEMQGYNIEIAVSADEITAQSITFEPNIIILDVSDDNAEKILETAQKLKTNEDTKNIKVIVSTTIHDKEMVLNTGADLYIPKPYELASLFNWIHKFLNMY